MLLKTCAPPPHVCSTLERWWDVATEVHPQPQPSNDNFRRLRIASAFNSGMVLQDLGRRINAAVTNLTRDQNLDEKVGYSGAHEIGPKGSPVAELR